MSNIQNTISLSLEGNIGCGKTTLLRIIQKEFPNIRILNEPLGEWENVAQGKVNLLDLYYKDPQRWGLTFQNYALFTRVRRWKENQQLLGSKLSVSERSLEADRYIFAQAMRHENYLSEEQYSVYLQYYEGYIKMLGIRPLNGIIYLRCSPQVCQQRINKRHREGEGSIPIQYLTLLHQKHEQWLGDKENILVVDSGVEFQQNIDQQNNLINRIREYVQKYYKN